MKKLSILSVTILLLVSCASKSDKALSDAKEVQKQIASMKPGTIATSDGGWTLRAKINGKEWKAAYIYPPDLADRISGGTDDISIGLPYDRRSTQKGDITKISHNNAVDLFLPDAQGGILGGYDGEIEITSADANWAEGKFHFTAYSSEAPDKKVEVTDGYFKISMAVPQK